MRSWLDAAGSSALAPRKLPHLVSTMSNHGRIQRSWYVYTPYTDGADRPIHPEYDALTYAEQGDETRRPAETRRLEGLPALTTSRPRESGAFLLPVVAKRCLTKRCLRAAAPDSVFAQAGTAAAQWATCLGCLSLSGPSVMAAA